MDYRVHFAFYVDVVDVDDEAEARAAAIGFVQGDLIERHRPAAAGALQRIRANLAEKLRAWYSRTERKPTGQ